MRNGLAPESDSGSTPAELPIPADEDLPTIPTEPPSREETWKAIAAVKFKKAAASDCTITAEALQGGGDQMVDVIHAFCVEVYTKLSPRQWVTNVIIPLLKKGDLSLMTNYRGISLMSIAAKVYNKILLYRIRPHVDPLLRSNQAAFRPGRNCAQQIHILRRF